jgi:hypothetical protein
METTGTVRMKWEYDSTTPSLLLRPTVIDEFLKCGFDAGGEY